ncbi:hypothetical protein AHiyo8_49190 [Arthrobacter sp. Hiyo8]|nr:hypothetical protein AHiyo8_49190 [Arthrobacter sp. Hiyo8]GAP57340.1 hypothetical protein AHiyo1_01720 [Arthrobacter sp. Hiyo1]
MRYQSRVALMTPLARQGLLRVAGRGSGDVVALRDGGLARGGFRAYWGGRLPGQIRGGR